MLTELEHANQTLASATAEERVAYALTRWKPNIVLSSSFGAQSAVLLHMVTRQWPDIPVVLLDTQYLFPETYKFADELTARLQSELESLQQSRQPRMAGSAVRQAVGAGRGRHPSVQRHKQD